MDGDNLSGRSAGLEQAPKNATNGMLRYFRILCMNCKKYGEIFLIKRYNKEFGLKFTVIQHIYRKKWNSIHTGILNKYSILKFAGFVNSIPKHNLQRENSRNQFKQYTQRPRAL